ncbi:hypothetical protein [Paenibacillus sp. CECT 9249]|nr:hypothetical protein [Paenibacillus sp. CECT 9249]
MRGAARSRYGFRQQDIEIGENLSKPGITGQDVLLEAWYDKRREGF